MLLALVGLVLFGQGAYIHAKALLAQVLLERAFAETIANASGIDPLTDGYELVLSTCWPFDAVTPGPTRYVLHATMIGLTGTSDEQVPNGSN